MAWTAPITYVSGAVATAAGMNTYVKDDLAYLKTVVDGTTPATALEIADANFKIYNNAGVFMLIQFDTGTDDFYYDRTNNLFYWRIGGVNKLSLDGTGKLTGAGFYSSGETSITNGNSATLAHGLGARPRFVAGFHLGTTGTEDAKVVPVVLGSTASVVGTLNVDATNIIVANNFGATRFVHIYAQR